MKRPRFNRTEIFVIGLIIAMTVYLSWFSLRKAEVYDWYSSDLGNMWQTVWNVGHGHGFQFTHTGLGYNVPRLSIHSDYFLILLAPLGWLPFGAASLLVLQAAVIALGAWFVYRIAQAWLQRHDWAFLISVAYLFFGPMQFAVVWQFHAVTLAVTFLLGMAEAIITKRRIWVFWLWLALAVSTKEHVGLIAGLMAWPLWWQRGNRRMAWWSFGLSWLYALLQLLVVIPAFRPGQSPNLFWDFYYGDLGSSPTSEIRHLFQPAVLIRRLFNQNILQNVLVLLMPLAWLPLFSGWIVLAAIAVLPHWLSGAESVTTLYFHNHVLAIPPLMLGMIGGWRRLSHWLTTHHVPALGKPWLLLVPFWIIIGSVVFSPNPWSFKFNQNFLLSDPALHRFLQSTSIVPAAAPIGYSLGLGQYVRSRPEAYPIPLGLDRSDYILFYQPKEFAGERATSAGRHRLRLQLLRQYLDDSRAFRVIGGSEGGRIYQRIWEITPEPLPATITSGPNIDLPARTGLGIDD